MAVVINKREKSAGADYNPNARKPYMVRWTVAGRQRERSFTTSREARDYRTKVEYEARTQSFTDPRLGTVPFTEYAREVIAGRNVSPSSAYGYRGLLNAWISPWAGDRTLRQVADDREGAARLLNVTMAHRSYSSRSGVRIVLLMIVREAVKAGRIDKHRLDGIGLVRADDERERRGFVFPSYAEVSGLAARLERFGPVVWLMRGCGLRIREALAVQKDDFRDYGSVLRCQRQSSRDGRQDEPLKHRKPGEYRDIPVPGYLWEMMKDKPAGPVCPAGPSYPYFRYSVVYRAFVKARDDLGIPEEFTPHSLRHAFASALLGNGVPITDVAVWLGHQDVSVTFGIYHHLIPSSVGRAQTALDSEFQEWSGQLPFRSVYH